MDALDALTSTTIAEYEPEPHVCFLPEAFEPSLLLSVIIPARNEQDSLPACLESLLSPAIPTSGR